MNATKHHGKEIILASESKRRIQLLEGLRIPFKSVPSTIIEPSFDSSHQKPAAFAISNARQKAQSVAEKQERSVVIGMDTIGEYEGRVFEKPRDRAHAREMIRLLSGTTHHVITGIAIIDSDSGQSVEAAETTTVTFNSLSGNEIESYLDFGEWRGLACGYGIQGIGALFIEKVEGDYFNVVGFPLHRFYHLMKEMGLDILKIMGE
ncbi:septum formation protein Maf [Candidatus Peregrinibacteria bacterium]|nr:septum formation protein Maf [Candidatus Peregrinibacteria bacterium]